MDVVYLHKNDTDNDSEDLRYSLRSLKNIPHANVIIAGEKPDWVKNVTFIPVEQSKTKSENWMRNLIAAIESDEVSSDFIMMNDDFFFMQPMNAVPNLNFGSMEAVLALYDWRYPESSEYIENMRRLHARFLAQGHNAPISYELHTPMILNKQKIKQLREHLNGARMYQFRTMYGNHFDIGGESVKDVKVFIEARHNYPAYNENPLRYLREQVLLSTTGGSFKRGIAGEFIREHFVEPSSYEVQMSNALYSSPYFSAMELTSNFSAN